MVHGGCQSEVAVADAAAPPEQDRATREIERVRANVSARGGSRHHYDDVVLTARVLLDDHRVGTRRQYAAGEDADRFARAHRALEWMSGGDFADEPELHGRACHVGSPHCIAV